MNKEKVLQALENYEFDGVNHEYAPYDGYGKHESYQIKMRVLGSTIEVTKVYRNKFFNGKENEWEEEESTEILTGNSAIEFIKKRPFYFQQIRPDLF